MRRCFSPSIRLVDDFFQGEPLTAAPTLVGRNDDSYITIEDPIAERVRGESGKDNRMDRADPRTGQHEQRQFRDHGQIETDAIAFNDAVGLEHIGVTADPVVDLAVSIALTLARLIGFPDNRGLVAAFRQMPVDAIVGDIEFPALEPLDFRLVESQSRVATRARANRGVAPVHPKIFSDREPTHRIFFDTGLCR